MKEELTRVSTECASLRTDLIEAQREERRAKGILADEREQTRKEKEARERKRQELAGGDESLLLNSEDVEIAILRRDLNAMAGDAAIKDELIKELELHIEEAHQQVVELSENNLVLGERAEKVLLSLKRREEATVILEEEKR